MKSICMATCFVLAGVCGAHAQDPAPVDFPRFRLGEAVTVDLLGRFEVTSIEHVERAGSSDIGIERSRIGLAGEIFDVIRFEIERELEDAHDPWRDTWVGVRPADAWLARAGKFKVPFSRARTTSLTKHAFVSRPMASEALAPGRQLGIGAEGELFGKTVTFEAGGFRESAVPDELGASSSWQETAMGALRVGARPFRAWSRSLRTLEVAAAVTAGQRPERLGSVTGESSTGEAPFFPEVYVSGRRLRTGFEASWSGGPISLAGEYLRLADQRRGQGLRGEDLSDLVSDGWHTSATWRVFGTGRERDRPLGFAPLEGSAGTFELVGRVEALRFRSAATSGIALRSPRAAHVLANADHALTVGGNWYFSRFGRIQCNAIGERIDDAARSPVGSDRRFWTVVTRLQLHL